MSILWAALGPGIAFRVFSHYAQATDVWLWRLLNDERANFPKPVIVRRCRYFPLSEIEAWEEANRRPSFSEVA